MNLEGLKRRRVLTLEDLAEKADVGRNTIWRLENGVMGAQPRTIRKLAKALGVAPEELVEEANDVSARQRRGLHHPPQVRPLHGPLHGRDGHGVEEKDRVRVDP